MAEKRDGSHEVVRLLYDWHALAPVLDPDVFRRWSLASLGSSMALDRAVWWGVDPPGAAVGAARPSDACVWRRAPDVDDRIVDRPGSVLRASTPLGAEGTRQSLEVARGLAASPFDSSDRDAFEALAAHLMLAYAHAKRWWMTGARLALRPKGEMTAVTRVDGEVQEQTPGFPALLSREWSGWASTQLPTPLTEFAARRSSAGGRWMGRRIAVEMIPAGRSLIWIARPRHAADALTAREEEVARQFAAGGSYRAIADVLGLAPPTVRAHLRNIYAKLGVRSKSQLTELLR